MADQPLDIDDFFASLDAPAPAPAAEATPFDDLEPAFLEDATPQPTREEVLQSLDARDDALNGTTPTVEDAIALRESQAEISDEQDMVKALNLIAQFSEKLDRDVRASGDRVTTVFEEIHSLRLELNVLRNILQAQERVVRQLVAMISDGEELPEVPVMPEPAPESITPRRRSRRAS